MDCLEHGQGAAGVHVVALRQGPDAVGDKAPGAQAPVLRGHGEGAAQSGEFLQIEGVFGGAEAQGHRGGDTGIQHPPGQAVEGSNADAAAGQYRVGAGLGEVEAVAQAGEHVQLRAGHAAHQLPGALAYHLHQQHQGAVFGPVADGDGAAEEFPGQLEIDELSRRGDGGGIAGEHHFIGVRRQLPGVFQSKPGFFHHMSSFSWT